MSTRTPVSNVPLCSLYYTEEQYLKLIEDIIDTGVERSDRTGVGTFSKFGVQMRWNLRDGQFPLLTTKRVFFRGVAEELFWFLKGQTAVKPLQDKNVHIWDDNSTRSYFDSIGLCDREEGDLGPVYGFQWRHFGATYSTMHEDYTGQGIDQVATIIDQLKHSPDSRRIILSAWNPVAIPDMALPPCHVLAQWYVDGTDLYCQLYQRSGDMGLGVPFNIASYSLLTVLLAKVCGLQPAELIHTLGDAHVYKNHVDPLKVQVTRTPKPFPTLEVTDTLEDISAYTMDHIKVHNYTCHPKIDMKMAV